MGTEEKTKPKREYKNHFAFVCPPELRARLAEMAEKEERSAGYIVRKAVEEYLISKGY
ncbi:CopG family ribbon-helix-helix protein [Anabaena catenula]|uniref:CopG family transcriptional regulator n=1 Tax=Anabaena catenula FACHB-362 TaxID=2692877 RepID=A0ABR8JAF7_9NOST|nr:ribbon-helix-helix protein, CopG family [Anabaena catenula]MBD2694452.1 CopG family transcriptional regulator [Anabaena catenula FACHB-362]